MLVRAGGALGRDGSLRVTVGTDAENERFGDALAEVLASISAGCSTVAENPARLGSAARGLVQTRRDERLQPHLLLSRGYAYAYAWRFS